MFKATHYSDYGPGGRKCVCCGPSPKEKKSFRRMVKRRINERVGQEINNQLMEMREIS